MDKILPWNPTCLHVETPSTLAGLLSPFMTYWLKTKMQEQSLTEAKDPADIFKANLPNSELLLS